MISQRDIAPVVTDACYDSLGFPSLRALGLATDFPVWEPGAALGGLAGSSVGAASAIHEVRDVGTAGLLQDKESA